MTAPPGSAAAPARRSWDDLARSAADRFLGSQEEGSAEGDVRELLVLWLAGDAYALPVERVREIVRMRPITPVPHVPKAVRGVLSLRGEIVQIIDLRRRLALPDATPEERLQRQRIVVLHGDDGQMAGLLVDRVTEVMRVPADAVRPPSGRDADTVAGLIPQGERFVSLFDVDRLLELGRRVERGPAT
jgi:purine-binding chemotaxis protein CheW